LSGGRLVDAEINAIIDTTEGIRLQVSFGNETAWIYLWQVVAKLGQNFQTKSSMRWVHFEYERLELVILSKPFKTKELGGEGASKISRPIRRKIGISLIRI
jgi:hypothetical protein